MAWTKARRFFGFAFCLSKSREPLLNSLTRGAGDEIWLEDNNLNLEEGSDDMENIRILEERGVVVSY
jgi:hypothetical protein